MCFKVGTDFMSLAPTPSASRGDLILQPPFFTSSLFVNPFRDDIECLTDLFIEECTDDVEQPFALFKRIWQEQGWTFMHLKVFDARTRHTYLTVACRLFVERMAGNVEPLRRLVALFALYTFYFTQPSDTRISLYSIKHIAIAVDQYNLLLALPKAVSSKLAPYASHVLSALLEAKAFYILPGSGFGPYNPRVLPREVYVEEEDEAARGTESELGPAPSEGAAPKVPRKKGRPSKRDIAKRSKDAVAGLDRWLERTESIGRAVGGGEPGPSRARGGHALLSHAPAASRTHYRMQKARLLDTLLRAEDGEGVQALERANMAVLGRLKRIDAMAAEKGMEVGGEGGELTGLGRVERAVGELREGGQGLLRLTEGAGIGPSEAPGQGSDADVVSRSAK
ncbi:hypothetical protein BC834DRAFT_859357 [Gloeopeniophorella convolvens]|nr:hypothetical protein BC834DRAFT_859357 [Gloeopeniophorella convolvens]